MEKYKYEIYDYSYIGIPREKVFHRKVISLWEYEALKENKYSENEIVEMVFKDLKRLFDISKPSIYKYNPNFDFVYQIITPNKEYMFHETSGKKK